MYSTIILNIGGREWVDASVQLWMLLPFWEDAINFGLPSLVFCCWAPWARLFIVEIVYLGSYNVFARNTLIFTRLGDQEWVDGEGCCWMTFPIGKVLPNWAPFPTGLVGLGLSWENK